MRVHVPTEDEPDEGGEPVGVHSTVEKAKEAAAGRPPTPQWFTHGYT